MYPGINCFTPFSHLICPRHPRCKSISALGSHQAADSYSAPWESHPRPFIMGRPRIRKYHYPLYCLRRFGNYPNFSYKFYRSFLFGKGSHGTPTIWLNLSVVQVNVPDEWVFSCQSTQVDCLTLSLYYWDEKISFARNIF